MLGDVRILRHMKMDYPLKNKANFQHMPATT